MVKDTVCGAEVCEEDSYYSIFGGRVLYFCSEGCKDEYDARLEGFYERLAARQGENRIWPV
jgi:YHS domain-containing protein